MDVCNNLHNAILYIYIISYNYRILYIQDCCTSSHSLKAVKSSPWHTLCNFHPSDVSIQISWGCVLVFLHEIIWVFPAVKKMAPLYAWSALGTREQWRSNGVQYRSYQDVKWIWHVSIWLSIFVWTHGPVDALCIWNNIIWYVLKSDIVLILGEPSFKTESHIQTLQWHTDCMAQGTHCWWTPWSWPSSGYLVRSNNQAYRLFVRWSCIGCIMYIYIYLYIIYIYIYIPIYGMHQNAILYIYTYNIYIIICLIYHHYSI